MSRATLAPVAVAAEARTMLPSPRLELHESNEPRAWEVQARLLSGQSDADIAAKCNLALETATVYGQLLFDVRCRRHAWAWILSRVIGHGPWEGFRDNEVQQFWAWMGWAGGPPIVDLLIEQFLAVCRPGNSRTLGVYLPRCLRPHALQCVVATAVMPRNAPAAVALAGLQVDLLEAQAADDGVRAARLRDRVQGELIRLARAT